MRDTAVCSANTRNGSRILRFMRGLLCCRRFWRCLGLANGSDHVERTFRIVLEFVAQDALTAIQRVLEADELSSQASKWLSCEKRLGEKAFQSACAPDHTAVLSGKLLQPKHRYDVLELGVLRERAPYFLRQTVMAFADDAGRGHSGAGLQGIDGREQPFAGSFARQ